MFSRRGFFTFAVGIIAAPAIVKVSALMSLRGKLDLVHVTEEDVFTFATQGMDAEGYEAHFADMASGKGMIARRGIHREYPKFYPTEAAPDWRARDGFEWSRHHGTSGDAPDMVYRT
jgi:hypothetical protein